LSSYPLEIFLIEQDDVQTFFNTQSNNYANLLTTPTTPYLNLIYHNLLLSSLNSVYIYNDATCYNNYHNFIYLSSFSCLLKETRINFLISLDNNSQKTLYSSSSLFLGSQ
jgi:hypothetical protein